jgi:hypothetical protein
MPNIDRRTALAFAVGTASAIVAGHTEAAPAEFAWGHGLPAKGQFCRLLYNEPAQSLVAAFQQKIDDERWSEDLYYRHKSSADYIRISGSDEQIHYSDVISCASVPKIFFNVTRWNDRGGDWESLASFDLATGELRTEATAASFREQRVWVSSLISAKDDASSVFCTIGFEQRLGGGALNVHYWLCELRLVDFALTKIAALPNAFV